MNTSSNSAVNSRIRSRGLVRGLAALVLLVSLLLGFNSGSVQASKKPTPAPVWSAFPAADGTVTDTNFDGKGDWVGVGVGSVVVGFNALGQSTNAGPGEHRGVYEFDVRTAPKITKKGKALLYLNEVGTRYFGTDNHLTLYVGKGDGKVDLPDFRVKKLAAAFDTFNGNSNEFPYDYIIDVTKFVRHLADRGDPYIVFVIRPNPAFKDGNGAYLFSSNEIAIFSDQFVPPKLVIEN